jgi:hypothetical protein
MLNKSQGLVWLEGLGKFKKITSLGLEPVTFQVLAQCLNHYATASYVHIFLNSDNQTFGI